MEAATLICDFSERFAIQCNYAQHIISCLLFGNYNVYYDHKKTLCVLVLYKDFCVFLTHKSHKKFPQISDSKNTTFHTNTTPPFADFAKNRTTHSAIYCTNALKIRKLFILLHQKCNILPMDYKIIKERRTILGLTQQDLSDYTGLSVRFIKSVEAGKGNPSIDSLAKIAEVLGLEIVLKVKESNV